MTGQPGGGVDVCAPEAPRRVDQRLEQTTVAGLLRVPLDTEDEPVTGQLDRFDDAVTAPGRDGQPAPRRGDGLMVAAQHIGPFAHKTTNLAPRLGQHGDRAEHTRAGLMIVRPDHVGQLLDQVPAEVDVEDLHPPTDSQHRKVTAEGRIQ